MRTDFHSRRRIAPPSRTAMRREPCHVSWPARLDDRLYIGHADETGTWSLYVNGELLMITAGPNAARLLAAAMLGDAFPGRAIRDDLLDAFADAWTPPDGGFVMPADLVAGWSLRWALDQPECASGPD
jgi:hypothetical protein